MTGGLWGLATILGPILLLGVIIWAYLRNKRGSKADIARAEHGAKELREEIAEDEARRGSP